jgi:hypothetical protein
MYVIYSIIKKLLLFVFLHYIHNYNSSNERPILSTIFSNKLTCALNWMFQFTLLSETNHAKFFKKKYFFCIHKNYGSTTVWFCNCDAQDTYTTMNIDPIQQQSKYCK